MCQYALTESPLVLLLVAKERVRDPDVDSVKPQRRRLGAVRGVERKSRVVPRLAQIHAHRVVLCRPHRNSTGRATNFLTNV